RQALGQHRGDARRGLAVAGAADPLAVGGKQVAVRHEVVGVEVAAVVLDEPADLLGVLKAAQARFDVGHAVTLRGRRTGSGPGQPWSGSRAWWSTCTRTASAGPRRPRPGCRTPRASL